MNGVKNKGRTSKIIQKLIAAVIFIIVIVHNVMKNILEKEELINIGSIGTFEKFEIEKIFHRRKEILDRSCSFIKAGFQLKLALC